MKGIVTHIQENGFVEIQTNSFIAVVELIGGYEVEVGDEISGQLDNLGGETIYNISQYEEVDVFIQNLK
jgi:hypothetical protein